VVGAAYSAVQPLDEARPELAAQQQQARTAEKAAQPGAAVAARQVEQKLEQ
jgi:hypothetical protein